MGRPQDLTCEPQVLSRTGLSVREHQRRTVDNFVELQMLWGDEQSSPWMPVLQGVRPADYARCMDLYARVGVDLTRFPVVGVGSVCRRQASGELDGILSAILRRDPEMPLHAFGCKTAGLARYGHKIFSADSTAWSYQARRSAPLPGHRHRSCANCLTYGLRWRERVLAVTTAAAAKTTTTTTVELQRRLTGIAGLL